MNGRHSLVYTLIVFLLTGCSTAPTAPVTISGTYEYLAYDSTGVPAVRGVLTLRTGDSITLSGSWSCTTIGTPGNIGPQVGNGILAGTLENDSTMLVNLNPAWVDNNVFLNGVRHGTTINGEWHFITIVGETNKGRFTATKGANPK